MGQITKHFKLEEFAVSHKFPALAELIKFTEADELKLYYMCATLLEPIREQFGEMNIHSGKRSYELNVAVGGEDRSDHLYEGVSCAVDLSIKPADLTCCLNWIRRTLPYSFGQLIHYSRDMFIHVSLPTPKHYGEVLQK